MDIQDTEPRRKGGPEILRSSVSRRTVVGVGVAAAWTIPLIQLATASPAAAASYLGMSITNLTGSYERTSNKMELWLNIGGEVVNTSLKPSNPTSSSVTLTFYLPTLVSTAAAPTIRAAPTGWTGWGQPTITWDTNKSATVMYTAQVPRGVTSFAGLQLNIFRPLDSSPAKPTKAPLCTLSAEAHDFIAPISHSTPQPFATAQVTAE